VGGGGSRGNGSRPGEYLPPPRPPPPRDDPVLPVTLPVLHLAATLFMTGVIVFVQVVHYPLMARVGADAYRGYQEAHMRRTTWVVLPGMGAELAAALGLAVTRLETPDATLALVGVGLLAVIWGSTAAVQAPLHGRLASGFEPRLHRRLVRSNWVRTAAWGARVPVALLLV
jgi:hypothetical protein